MPETPRTCWVCQNEIQATPLNIPALSNAGIGAVFCSERCVHAVSGTARGLIVMRFYHEGFEDGAFEESRGLDRSDRRA